MIVVDNNGARQRFAASAIRTASLRADTSANLRCKFVEARKRRRSETSKDFVIRYSAAKNTVYAEAGASGQLPSATSLRSDSFVSIKLV